MKREEQGIALVITLFLMASLSALAVSMMFLAQTETASSRNYRTMSQARYAGEAGVHKAMNYLLNTYTAPSSMSSYGITKTPVTCVSGCTNTTAGSCNASTPALAVSTGCIVLTANFGGLSGNYPDSTIRTAFSTAGQGTLPVNGSGSTSNGALGVVSFGTAAVLMSMKSVTVYGGGTGVVQTWQIVADGAAGPTSAVATVEVMGIYEKTVVPAETFAVFATSPGCGAITYDGSGGTDSYDSTSMTLSGGVPVTQNSGGAIGTNGNLNIGGAVGVNGTLSTPRTGVGSCTAGAVTAETQSGTATVSGGMIQLPQAKSYPTPTIPAPGTTDLALQNNATGQSDCAALATAQGWTCTYASASNTFTLTPVTSTTLNVKDFSVGSNVNLVIAGTGQNVTINANSITAVGNTSLAITASTVTMNLTGTAVDPVMDFQGNFSTTAFDPSVFQIMYAGTGNIKLRGNNELAATIYAPNSHVDMASSYDVYGSILAGTYTNSGGAMVHYDRSLATKYFTISNPFMSAFTWRKY